MWNVHVYCRTFATSSDSILHCHLERHGLLAVLVLHGLGPISRSLGITCSLIVDISKSVICTSLKKDPSVVFVYDVLTINSHYKCSACYQHLKFHELLHAHALCDMRAVYSHIAFPMLSHRCTCQRTWTFASLEHQQDPSSALSACSSKNIQCSSCQVCSYSRAQSLNTIAPNDFE